MIDKKYILFALLLLLYIVVIFGYLDFEVGIDYSVYYTSGKMALEGDANKAYDLEYHHQENEKYLEEEIPFTLGWYYPPIYYFAVLPLAFFSLKTGYILWMIITFILYLYGINKLKKPYFLALSFTGIIMTIIWGQNSFILVFLTAMFISKIDEPRKAGFYLGLLCFKPHFAILYFVILFLKKEWQILKHAILSAAALLLLSGLAFGFDSWIFYIQSQMQSGSILIGSNWRITNAIQPSIYSSLVLAGLANKLAMVVQLLIGLLTVVLIYKRWDSADQYRKGGLLVLGTFLINPYFLLYDLTLLIIPIILMSDEKWYFRINKYFLWLLPMLSLLVVHMLHFQMAPIIIIFAFLLMLLRNESAQIS